MIKNCTKSLLTLALGLGLQSAAFAQAPNESAKPKPNVTAMPASKAGSRTQQVAKPEAAAKKANAKLEGEKTSQPMAAATKSASPKPTGDKVMSEKNATKSANKKVSKPGASPTLSKPTSK